MFEFVVATGNKGKIKELKELLADLPARLRSLNDFPNIVEAKETGATFAANAAIKAKSYALQIGFWTLADDSGLEVAALGGAPGVYSARYAGETATDRDRIEKLLRELNDTPMENRAARFVCAMAISDETGAIKFSTEAVCDGQIALIPSGANGFGYDPIFIPDDFNQTFGELSETIKQKISHRARASRNIIRFLRDFHTTSLDQSAFRL